MDDPLKAGGKEYEANFVKIALNVIRPPGTEDNQLASVLRSWFGPDAGLGGTRFSVRFVKEGGPWEMQPINPLAHNGPQLWQKYSREQIPPLFGLEFNASVWNQGFVLKDKQMFLLVTLNKGDLEKSYAYKDHFIDRDTFHWQSQNRTKQDSKAGRAIKGHVEQGISVHLLVRKDPKARQKASPFVYCGELDFVSWEGEKPISVIWKLRNALPGPLFDDWQ